MLINFVDATNDPSHYTKPPTADWGASDARVTAGLVALDHSELMDCQYIVNIFIHTVLVYPAY